MDGATSSLDSSTLTPLIKRLNRLARRDTADEGGVILTDKGRAIAADAACVPAESAQALGFTLEHTAGIEPDFVALRDQTRMTPAD